LSLAYGAIGVVYGDLATSPLYTLSSVWSSATPTQRQIQGTLSCILWVLTLVIIVKYTIFVLLVDDNGQGGTFAIYSLLSRYEPTLGLSDAEDQRAKTEGNSSSRDETEPLRSRPASFLKRIPMAHSLLLGTVLMASSMVICDGVLTPAISVMSAYEGILVQFPDAQEAIIPLSCITLFLLFQAQVFGTHKLARGFSPIIITFLASNASIGVWNIFVTGGVDMVLEAWNPVLAIEYMMTEPHAWKSLGSILLCITGTEALYADMGHFSRPAIQLATSLFAYPCLVLTYSGQSARVASDPENYQSPYWDSVPRTFYYPMLALSVLATIVASQGKSLISATFSIVFQAKQLDAFPPVKVVHTSEKVHGQIQIPQVTFAMMCLTMMVVLIFKSSDQLAGAYGIAVSFVMLITTGLVAVVMATCWNWHWSRYITFLVVFGLLDVILFSSTILKFLNGGWFPIGLASMVSLLMLVWRWGKLLGRQKAEIHAETEEEAMKTLLSHTMGCIQPDIPRAAAESSRPSDKVQVASLLTPEPCIILPRMGIFYSSQPHKLPTALYQFSQSMPTMFKVVVFLHLQHSMKASIQSKDRLVVSVTKYLNVYNVTARYGYMDELENGRELARQILDEIRSHQSRTAPGPLSSRLDHETDHTVGCQATETLALPAGTAVPPSDLEPIYILSRTELASDPLAWGRMAAIRKVLLEGIFNYLTVNTVSGTVIRRLPVDRSIVVVSRKVV
ncbi:potassium transporter, partial [Polychytrium aggregatum]|uniref:potassium transporter n=1 Tax=Polychytrium aggregatum TaxID=110093 RepID=UPI0022FDDB9E